MRIILFAWCATGVVVGLVWLIRLLGMPRVLRKRQILTPSSYPETSSVAPLVTVLVAGKDEERVIEACIRSLMQQDYPNLEVIAIDDRSRDRTPTILRALASEFGARLRVITIEDLPAGWHGKNHAMHRGVLASRGEWMCFTDADCVQLSPRTMSLAMQEVVTRKVDFLSITPMLDAPTAWEKIIQPVCTLVLLLWFQPKRVNNPQRKNAYANGAFMLLNRQCYEGIGGHEASGEQLNEDIFMARQAKERGFKLRVVENDGLYKTRMYPTPRAAWRGWSRIFYGCLAPIGLLGWAIGFVAALSLLPWMSAVLAWIMLTRTGLTGLWLPAAVIWTLAVFFQWLVLVQFYQILKLGRWWSFSYILGAWATFGMLLSALLKSWGATTTTWHGTTYRKHERMLDREASPKSTVPASPATERSVQPVAIEGPVQHV